MTSPTRLARLWAEDRPALNGWLMAGSADTAEAMAKHPWDSLTVDMQHGSGDLTAALGQLRAIATSDATPMIRVPWLEPGLVMRSLDAGAAGIICPMVDTPDAAAALVSWCRYPPQGSRSYGPFRAGRVWGTDPVAANARTLVFAMIETAEALANLDAIAATPGLTGLYVGPSDFGLSLSGGALGPGFDREQPQMVEALQSVAAACARHGLVAALHCGGVAYARRAAGWGYRWLTVGSDAGFVGAGAAAVTADWTAGG